MLVDEGVHVMMLEEVRAAQASGGAWKGFHERAVFAVMNMAQHGALIDVLKASSALEVFTPLLKHKDSEIGLSAVFVIVFLEGKDEGR
jgi:type III secretory pathway component EscT